MQRPICSLAACQEFLTGVHRELIEIDNRTSLCFSFQPELHFIIMLNVLNLWRAANVHYCIFCCYFVAALRATKCKFHLQQPGFIFSLNFSTWSYHTWLSVHFSICSHLFLYTNISNLKREHQKKQMRNKVHRRRKAFLIKLSEHSLIHLKRVFNFWKQPDDPSSGVGEIRKSSSWEIL